ncbi:MAG: hydroxymethylbilane synthase [Bacteroidetes bacterium]|nr:MAG: hydroxymethylbilane synthase [Bacteroidota bacterium]
MLRIRVGTRDSALAMWQAREVAGLVSSPSVETSICMVKSEGDTNLITPLYEWGIQGIFTKALDIALLNNEIDIAVHSLKDVPTTLANGLTIAAVLPRANPYDVLVCRTPDTIEKMANKKPLIIATCSIRRKAQWLHKFPNTTIESIRGNVQTRLQKLHKSHWDGAIFAAAGLERLGIMPETSGIQIPLHWMLPAPAQGAIVVLCRATDSAVLQVCSAIQHWETALCTQLERDVLKHVLGGCSTPVSAHATIYKGTVLHLVGNITAPDGSVTITVERSVPVNMIGQVAMDIASELLEKGGKKILAC